MVAMFYHSTFDACGTCVRDLDDLSRKVHNQKTRILIERIVPRQAIPRKGVPYDLKGAIALFASSVGQWITGQNLIVDGGWTTR